jgi:hypothetical protein
MGRPTKLDLTIQNNIVASIREGKNLSDAARLAGICQPSFHAWLRRGKQVASGIFLDFYDAVELAKAESAANALSLGKVVVTKNGKRVVLRGRMVAHRTHRADFFAEINTEEKAYWLGVLATDGNVLGKRISLVQSLRDREFLEAFKHHLGSDAPVVTSRKKDTTVHFPRERGPRVIRGADAGCVNLWSERMVEDLRRHGIVERKSFTVKPWDGPRHLMRHYWRGAVDGDGSVMLVGTRRQPYWRVAFCGNEHMVHGFRDFISRELGHHANPRKQHSIWYVTYSGRMLPQDIARLLYEGAKVSLERKRKMADKIMSTTLPMTLTSPYVRLKMQRVAAGTGH